ncbi:MAG: SIMPL domain-containing protein [Bryobacteraceae bacterium]|jgi:uncharacterized protein YggE
MWKLSLSILLLAVAPVFGQLKSHTVTVSATRSINVQADQVVFGLSVSAAATTSLDQIVAALAGIGITSASLTGVGTNFDPPAFQWSFTLAVPFSSLTAIIGSLTKLEQTIAQNNSGLALTFSVNGTQVSQQLQQSQTCSNSDLIADATAQAQKLAAAAGMTLGQILKLTSVPSTQGYFGVPTLALLGNFANAELFLGAASSPVTCSLVVQFQLQL